MRGLALLLLALASCSASGSRAPAPLELIDRLPDPEAERSLERHLEAIRNRPIQILNFEGRVLFISEEWPPAVEVRPRVLPDYGLYANPIP